MDGVADLFASFLDEQVKLLQKQAEKLRNFSGSEGAHTDDKKKKVKKEKDPNAVKRPLSAYQLFIGDQYKKMKQSNPEVPSKDLFGLLSKQWSTLAPETKSQYIKQSEDAKDHPALPVVAPSSPVPAPKVVQLEKPVVAVTVSNKDNKGKPPQVKVKEPKVAAAPAFIPVAPTPAPKAVPVAVPPSTEKKDGVEESGKKKKDKKKDKKRHSEGGDGEQQKKKVKFICIANFFIANHFLLCLILLFIEA